MVSVINIELRPDVFQLHSCHSTFPVSQDNKKGDDPTVHKSWSSFHPVNNLKRRKKVKMAPRNRDNKRSNEIFNKSPSVQSVPDKFDKAQLFQNIVFNSEDVKPGYFRSEMDLSNTELPEKDIRILNLLVKK